MLSHLRSPESHPLSLAQRHPPGSVHPHIPSSVCLFALLPWPVWYLAHVIYFIAFFLASLCKHQLLEKDIEGANKVWLAPGRGRASRRVMLAS